MRSPFLSLCDLYVLKINSDIKHLLAWLYGSQSPRIKHYPYPTTNFWNSIISLLPVFFQHELCKWGISKMLKSAVSAEYFPEKFLQGGILHIFIFMYYNE